MAHKTLVGGTAYNITGGKSMVSGTTYNIAKGCTLVNGTGYEISFGPTVSTILNDNNWETISAISTAGQAANYWAVGDTKQITINGAVGNTTFSNLNIWVFILGFDHNSTYEGSNTIHFQIGKSAQTGGKNICLIDAKYSASATSSGYFSIYSGGWESSNMRVTVLGNGHEPSSPVSGSLMAALPSDLRNVMRSVTKYTDNVGNGKNTASNVTATTDYIWLLSEYEVFGHRSYANSAEQNYQNRYNYYINNDDKDLREFYKYNQTSTAA